VPAAEVEAAKRAEEQAAADGKLVKAPARARRWLKAADRETAAVQGHFRP
jgi:hypothetical protein